MSTNGYNGNCNFQSQPASNGAAAKIGREQAQQFQQQQQQLQQHNSIIANHNAANSVLLLNHQQQQQQIQSPSFNQSANKSQNHKEKLDEIRQQLQPYMINERPTSSASSTSETSSNYVKHVHGIYDASMIYQHHANNYASGSYPVNPNAANYVPPPPLNYPTGSQSNHQSNQLNNQLTKYLENINGQLIDYYKQNGYSYASDKQSPTPNLQLNGSNNNKQLLVTSLNSFAPLPNLLGNGSSTSSGAYHKTAIGQAHNSNNFSGNSQSSNLGGNLIIINKSELTSPTDDHQHNGQQQQFGGSNNPPPPAQNLATAKLQAWSVRQTKSQSPVIMQSVKSTQVQKPILQTACAPVVNACAPHSSQQQQPPPLITSNAYQLQQLNSQLSRGLQFNEKSLKTDLVQLNPNIAKKFLSKVIALEQAGTEEALVGKPAGGYAKQQMPLPEPPKSSISNSPVYSVISDKSNLSSNLTGQLTSLEQQFAIRTSSALSNCSNSSKFTSYSNASSSINQPPPYKPPYLVVNQTVVHAKPVTVNSSNFIEEPPQSRPPPSYCESILNSSTSSSSNYVTATSLDHQLTTNHPESAAAGANCKLTLATNNSLCLPNGNNLMLNQPQPQQQPIDPPSYASSVAVLIKQKNQQIDLMNKQAKNGAIKINRPLPPLPTEKPEEELRSNMSTPIQQTGPPLPPKPSKLAASLPEPHGYIADELDCSSAAFNATSNLQQLQQQLEQHLQQQRPLVEKLKQIHLQKHQQKVLSNLKANSNASSNINNLVNQAVSQQQQQQQHLQKVNQPITGDPLPPPILPAKNSQQSTTKSIAAMKRPVPAPPLLPKKECLLNKNRPRNEPLNSVPPPGHQPEKRPLGAKQPNEYENTPKEMEPGDAEANSGSFHSNDEQPDEECRKTTHHSPIPQRKFLSKEREAERRESKVKNYSSAAYRFFMEQHIENVIKSQQQRENRKNQLENEMLKAKLTHEAQSQMRKMLQQKESNYIRLKRARMEKSMFEKIQTLGVGAFGKWVVEWPSARTMIASW